MTYTNIEKCGLYQDDCWEWSRKPRLNKKWSNFKAHFDWAFKETQRPSRTSNTKVYAENLHATQANAALCTKMQQDHTLSLENLAMATETDRTLVALLTKTKSDLSSQVPHLTAKFTTAQAENACLINRDIVQPRLSTVIGRPAIRTRQIRTQSKTKMCSKSGPKFDPNGYCSSCSYKVEEAHTPTSCCFPKNGQV